MSKTIFIFIGILINLTPGYPPATLILADQLNFLNSLDEIEQFREVLRPFLRERVSGTKGNLLVQEHIRHEMRNLGWHLDEDRFIDETPFGATQFTNIVATLDPKAPSRLTLACHYDSKKFDNFVFIGATDAAVPCALMIDLAKRLNASLWDSVSRRAKTTVQLIFFDGEEAFVEWSDTDSLYGSRHLAQKMDDWEVVTHDRKVISAIKAMSVLILLDLIGTTDCKFLNFFPTTSHLYINLQHTEKQLFAAGLLEPRGQTSEESVANEYFTDKLIPKWMRSGITDDHVPFMRRNVSILHLISYPFPKVWHQATDNEEVLSYPTINNLARILSIFVADYLNLLS